MKTLYRGVLCLLAVLLLCVPLRAGRAEEYNSGYTNGFWLEYDPEYFDIVGDDFMETYCVRFEYTGETEYPIFVEFRCFEGDEMEVCRQLDAQFEQEERDGIVGRNYYDAMTYYVVDETGASPETSLFFIVPFYDGVFQIELHGYNGQPAIATEKANELLDTFELGGD